MIIIFPLIICLIIYFKVFYFHSTKSMRYDMPEGKIYDKYKTECIDNVKVIEKISFEEVTITSFDGLKLYGRLFNRFPGKPFHILFHGYKSDAYRDMSMAIKNVFDRQNDVLLVDQRAHGSSQGRTITFGIKERYDVKSWVDFISERFGKDTKIIISGISMGAASVLMSAGLDLPKNVCGILADCPFSSPYEIINHVAAKVTGFKYFLFPFIFAAAYIFGRFNLAGTFCKDSIKNSKIPILLIHGTGDDFVPVFMSDELLKVRPDITYVRVFNAPHGMSFFVDKDQYMKAYNEYMNSVLS